MEPVSGPGGSELYRWKNLCVNNDVFHVALIRNGDQIEYRLLNRKQTPIRRETLPSYGMEHWKTIEPVLEGNESVAFCNPLVDWSLPAQRDIRIRCLVSQTQAYWQTWDPQLDIRTTMPFVAESSPACPEETKRLIRKLDPKNPEHAALLPFFKCVSIQFRDKANLEPITFLSTFNSKCKVNYFKWAVTLITHKGKCGNHAQVAVEGIADQTFVDKFKHCSGGKELSPTKNFQVVFHFTGTEIKISFRPIEFTERSPIIMIDSKHARAMLAYVVRAQAENPPVIHFLEQTLC